MALVMLQVISQIVPSQCDKGFLECSYLYGSERIMNFVNVLDIQSGNSHGEPLKNLRLSVVTKLRYAFK